MAKVSIMTILPFCLLLPTALALPQFWPHGYHEKPYPTLTISSSDGVCPTGVSGTTGTGSGIATGTGKGIGSGTAYYPTATASAPILKRDPDHPFGYPPPTKPLISSDALPTSLPTASALPTSAPTGTAPPASGTGTSIPRPSYIASEQEVNAAKQAHRQHFEGPRKQKVKPYYPYAPSQSYGGGAVEPSATAPTGATGTGIIPWPLPTGTSIWTIPLSTGASSTALVPSASGTGGSYPTASIRMRDGTTVTWGGQTRRRTAL